MPDVTIIGTRADQARLDALAKVLEARGFTVAVGEADATVKAAVVAWTQASVKDAKVQAAASQAGDQMVGVFLDAVAAPAPFNERGGELLTTWPAISSQGSFERLVHRLETMTGRTAASSGAVPQAILAEAAKAARALEGRRRFWPRVLTVGAVAAVGLIGYGVFTSMPSKPDDDDGAPKTCEAAQQFCLSKEQIQSASERELVRFVLDNASKEAVEAGAAAKDPLAAGLLCLIDVSDIKDALAAQKTCQAAAQLGSPLGQLGLATLFEQGPPPIAKDMAAARALLAAAADAGGDERAQMRLAWLEHADGNYQAANAQLDKCVPAGDKDCRFLRAFMLEKAQGGPANVVEAVRIYTELAEPSQEYPRAAVNLAYIYETGAPPDIAANQGEALRLYQLGAVFQHPYAVYKLGEFAERGQLEGAGAAEALNYYREAAGLGSAEAKAALDRLSKEPQP